MLCLGRMWEMRSDEDEGVWEEEEEGQLYVMDKSREYLEERHG